MVSETLPVEIAQGGVLPGCVTLTLDQPGRSVVVLDHDLVRRLEITIGELPKDATGLVLTSASDRVFVAGADLKQISEFDDDQLAAYLSHGSRVFGLLANLPYPTVAAINGAALGGGLELALHCDGLVAAPSESGRPYPIGLPEAGLGLCPGWGGSNTLPARIDPATAIRLTAEGTPLTYDQAVEAGLFDVVADSQGELVERAMGWLKAQTIRSSDRDGAPLRWIGRSPVAATVLAGLDEVRSQLPDTEAARAVAASVDAGLLGGWASGLACEQDRLIRIRHTQTSRDAIAAFFEKSARK